MELVDQQECHQAFLPRGNGKNSKGYDKLVTIGLRGDEDRPITDAGSREANFRLMEQIISEQRKIIADATRKPASETPQVWTLYSEVLDYYDQGTRRCPMMSS